MQKQEAINRGYIISINNVINREIIDVKQQGTNLKGKGEVINAAKAINIKGVIIKEGIL
jgi:hypothetical protein